MTQPSRAKRVGTPFAAIDPNPMVVLDQQNNWGRTETINEDYQDQLVRVQLDVMAYITVTVRAIQFDNGTNPTQLYPFAEVKWGNGNVLTTDVIDATGGAMEVVNASTVEVTVFLQDADGNSPVPGSGASAQFQAMACVGLVPYPQHNTGFHRSTSTAPAVVIEGDGGLPIQGHVTQIYGFVDNTSGAEAYLLIFDSNVPPSGGDPNPGPLLEVFALPTGFTNFEKMYPNFLPFINGISYGVSSSPTTYVAAASTTLRVTVESTRD